MDITEVRIKLMDDPHDRLQAFCSITLDGMFVIRDLKIIQGAKGPFVAMPSRKLTDRCPKCYSKNHLRAQFCNQCGVHLDEGRATKDSDGRAKLYADIAHPINSSCRELIQSVVVENFESEKIRSQEPNYICTYDDFDEENFATLAGDSRQTPSTSHQSSSNGSTVIQREERTHRIDPPQSPGATHSHINSSEQKSYSVTAERHEQSEEGFGNGLV
ncbi:Putative septation protein SpoVG [Polystyrenella longa]|uniref:Septation protein SpoVG n=1 Tax=Polystyrenella longa TaxID=2528007 RepID=A0A518CRI8_9PLAN|nr:SpoVG family protein [Polystyrenella longa]QDU81833.1 Putative septation protein SpoVG [Polystyrenella longa]